MFYLYSKFLFVGSVTKLQTAFFPTWHWGGEISSSTMVDLDLIIAQWRITSLILQLHSVELMHEYSRRLLSVRLFGSLQKHISIDLAEQMQLCATMYP